MASTKSTRSSLCTPCRTVSSEGSTAELPVLRTSVSAGFAQSMTWHASPPAVSARGLGSQVSFGNLDGLPEALVALRQAHPYEEPPVEVHALSPRPRLDVGAGRIGRLSVTATTGELVERMRARIPAGRFAIHDPSRRRKHELVGLCAGSGGELLDDAISAGCTIFVTGELKHHDVLRASSRGCSVILAGHTNTERGWLKVLRRRLRRMLPAVEFEISRSDKDPLRSA